MSEVYAKVVKVSKLTDEMINGMFGIMEKYYHGVDLSVFKKDLLNKTDVIILRNSSENRVIGFSTLAIYHFKKIDKKSRWGIFSGDTIIEKKYWGNTALQKAFALFCVKFMVLHPFSEVFWLLISKGYKTYLLLANNFIDYYPHPTRNQDYKALVEDYSEALFPGCYDKEKEVLDFGENYQKLKADVAGITPEMRKEYPRIDFFEKRNPGWKDGKELPCIAAINMKTAYYNFFVKKTFVRNSKGSKRLPNDK